MLSQRLRDEFKIAAGVIAQTLRADPVTDFLPPLGWELTLVGSCAINEYRPGDSDIDILVYHPGLTEETLARLGPIDGWDYGGSTGAAGDHSWASYTQRVQGIPVNMIFVTDHDYMTRWCMAVEVCKFLKMRGVALKKSDIHGVHQIIMDDTSAITEHATRGDY